MGKQNGSSAQEGAAGKSRAWIPALLLLLVLALITSSIVGYLLGRNAGTPPLGQVIDTIVLEPEAPDAQTALHLAGRVLYADGTPAARRTLELHSNPMVTVSDANGGFLFENVPQGAHTVSILNADGTVAAEKKIIIARGAAAENVSVTQQPGGAYLLEIAVDIRVLEIELELDAQTLTIRPDFSYATVDGAVTTPAGTASVRDGVIVTPQGNVFLPDGSVVFPGGDGSDPTRILLPDGSMLVDQPYDQDGITVSSGGVVQLPDSTVIAPGGQITTPDGGGQRPGETGVLVGGGTVKPIGEAQPVSPTASAEPTASPRPGNPGTPTPAPTAPPAETPQPPMSTAGTNKPSTGPNATPEPEIPDDGELNAYGQNADGTYAKWTQNCTIDLFFNRSTGSREKIAPGSSGYYLFRLENGRKSALRVQVILTEGSVHLPLSFALTPLDAQGNPQAGKAVSGSLGGSSLTLNAPVAAGDAVTYRLDWEWPFEGNDEKDTAAGSGADLVYPLLMKIHAEEGA